MGVIIVHFQGTICHAVADDPKIQRALVPNGEHVDGVPPHRAKLYLKKNEVEVASLEGLDPQELGAYYFVYVGGHEVGIENLTEKAVTKDVKFNDFTPGLQKDGVKDLRLHASAYTSTPDRNVVSAYMELSGKLDACRTKQKAKFNTNELRNFADIVTMTTTSSDRRPILFVRPYGSSTRHQIRMTVEKPEVSLVNDPEGAAHNHAGSRTGTLNHFILQYRLAANPPLNPPVPHDPGPDEKVTCPRVPTSAPSAQGKPKPFLYNGGAACSNASYP